MRDNLNFNILPIAHDNMNSIAGVRTLINISSNAYYGYQPPLLGKLKEAAPPPGPPHVQPFDESCRMEVQQFGNQNENINRKRCCEYANDFREFKKRRENEKINDNAKKKFEEDLFEELLKQTHGCSVYHWKEARGLKHT